MNLDIKSLMEMQDELQALHKGEWTPIAPGTTIQQMLWMVGEIGEAIDIIKKIPPQNLTPGSKIREHFVEEMCDVMMYFIDVLQCCGVTSDEFCAVYQRKHDHNMRRDYVSEHVDYEGNRGHIAIKKAPVDADAE